jgi:hypothetical protein
MNSSITRNRSDSSNRERSGKMNTEERIFNSKSNPTRSRNSKTSKLRPNPESTKQQQQQLHVGKAQKEMHLMLYSSD